MLEPDEVFAVNESDPDAALAAVAAVLAAGDASWVNLVPEIDGEIDQPPSLVRIFSARGPEVPVITVVGPSAGRNPKPASFGLEHAGGQRAVATLREAGVRAPANWTLRQDHPRRGLVIELPADAAAADVLTFGWAAARVLSSQALPVRWLVARHRRR